MTISIFHTPSAFSNSTQSSVQDSMAPADLLWHDLCVAAQERATAGGITEPLIRTVVLDAGSLATGLARILSHQQLDSFVSGEVLEALFLSVYAQAPALTLAASLDLEAIVRRDPAAQDALTPFLYFKGFHAIQTHRAAHWLWGKGQQDEALFLQNRSALLYAVDIHPAAQMGSGIMLDHATGLVIGETAVVEDNVSILHNVTLGGTGKESGDRHPKVRAGVMIGAGAKILGNVEIGVGACIAAGSVVLERVLPHTTVAGIPARIVGTPRTEVPADEMDQAVIPSNN